MARARRGGGYLPSFDFLGPGGLGIAEPDPVSRNHGKSIARQETDSPVGRRGAGLSQVAEGDPLSRQMHVYKKGATSFSWKP